MPAPLSVFLRLDSIRARSQRADFKRGKEIADRGEVEIIERSEGHVLAKAGAKSETTQRRRTELRATADGLSWRCSCNNKPELFCKHCVATALVTR